MQKELSVHSRKEVRVSEMYYEYPVQKQETTWHILQAYYDLPLPDTKSYLSPPDCEWDKSLHYIKEKAFDEQDVWQQKVYPMPGNFPGSSMFQYSNHSRQK